MDSRDSMCMFRRGKCCDGLAACLMHAACSCFLPALIVILICMCSCIPILEHCHPFLQYSNVNAVCRHADITTLQFLHIVTTAVMLQQQQQQQQSKQGHDRPDIVHDNPCSAHLEEANAQIALLVRGLKAQSTCRASARYSSTIAVAATESLPELTQAVVSAISGLRKVLQAKATGKATAGQSD